jgi:uncharacterized protein YdcH (DUF465 family)
MDKRDEELITRLLPVDEELRHYYEEHVELESQLTEFNRRLYLSPEQEVAKKDLQKRKLLGKDRIMEILQRHRGADPARAS